MVTFIFPLEPTSKEWEKTAQQLQTMGGNSDNIQISLLQKYSQTKEATKASVSFALWRNED